MQTRWSQMTSLSKAFTMIELIFVIVVIGIASAIFIPKMEQMRKDATVQTQSTQQDSDTTEWNK